MATKPQDNPVIREILRQGKGKDKRLVAAALETGRIESNFTNLPGGDADSVNWRQERASIYGGDMSIRRSVARFYKEAAQLDKGQPSYGLAADVQRPAAQYRGRYKDAHGEALQLLGSSGGGADSYSPASPAQASAAGATTTTPGVDNSGLRKQLVGQFLQQGGVANPNAVLTLAGSYGQAADTPGTTTTAPSPSTPTLRSAPKTTGKSGSKVLELIYNDGGEGYGIKDGQTVNGSQVFADVWEGHAGHVHAAAGPNTIVALGKLAQSMGLNVGENEYFTGQNPGAGVHSDTSNHYREGKTKSGKEANLAIDVSGDPKKMAAFAKKVAAYNRTRKL